MHDGHFLSKCKHLKISPIFIVISDPFLTSASSVSFKSDPSKSHQHYGLFNFNGIPCGGVVVVSSAILSDKQPWVDNKQRSSATAYNSPMDSNK